MQSRSAPPILVTTQCSGWPCRYNSVLDFVFVAGPAQAWSATSEIIAAPGDFPDSDQISDHRPVLAQLTLAGDGVGDTYIPALLKGKTAAEPPPNCDPSYATVCIPPPPPDLDCKDIPCRYAKINGILLALATALEIDLWRLDALWYYLLAEQDFLPAGETTVETGPIPPPAAIDDGQRFGLERHLHEFLRDNWPHTELARDWDLYREPGNDSAGYEYPCDVGRIDLLARHRREPKWLIVELKRSQTSDETVGQALRYMGWVKRNLAEENESVHGLIIAHSAGASLGYAVSMIDAVDLMLYEVHFALRPAPDPMEKASPVPAA